MIRTTSDRVRVAQFEPEKNPHRLEACRAYARALNNLDPTHLEPWLHPDDFTSSSQWVMEEMKGKEAYLDYLKGKFETIRGSSSPVWAEIGYTKAFGAGDCVIIAQKDHKNLVATVLIKMEADKIKSISMCGIPSPTSVTEPGNIRA